MVLNKLFHNSVYTTPTGVVIPLPIGVGLIWNPKKEIVGVRLNRKMENTTFPLKRWSVAQRLIWVIRLLKVDILNGAPAGLVRGIKPNRAKTAVLDTGEIGISCYASHHNENLKTYYFSVSFPDLEKCKSGKKVYYIGTDNNWSSVYDSKLRIAIAFRKERVDEYTQLFLDELDKTIQLLKTTK